MGVRAPGGLVALEFIAQSAQLAAGKLLGVPQAPTATVTSSPKAIVATDPAPGAEAKLRTYVDEAWRVLTAIGLAPGATQGPGH